MTWRRHAIAAASLAALAAPYNARAQAAASPAQNPEAQQQQPAGSQLERIVITSEKRMTMLDTTPASVTAISGQKLQEAGYDKIEDVVNLVPNTSLTGGAGAGGNTQIFIRGIGNVFILAGGDPGVALYSDGAYVSDMTSSNLSMFDLQRVEVLRGPQGSLYGRNATGGAMNLITALPSDSFRASANALIGNYGRKESEGFVSSPLGESGTGIRLSYQIKKLDGWTQNPLAGEVSGPVVPPGPTSVAPKRLDDLDSRAVRLQTLTDMGEGGRLRLMAANYSEDEAGPSMPLLVDPVMIPGMLFGVTPSSDPRVQKSQAAQQKIDATHFLANWKKDFGDNTLDVTASWRKSKVHHYFDSDMTEALVATTGVDTHSTDKSLDVHLTSPDDQKFQWLVGATVLRFDQRQDVDVSAQIPFLFLALPGCVGTSTCPPPNVAVPGGLRILLGGNVQTRSEAVYSDVRYQLTPQWALLGGLRVNRDHKTADEYQQVLLLGTPPAATNRLDSSWTSTPASLGAEYKIDADSIAYARASHGFKSGAVNLGALQANMVKPENATGVEVGYKLNFAQHRGLFSAALFSNSYRDMQMLQVGKFQVELTNASKARINGAEFELSAKPVPALTVNAALGLMDPKFTNFTNVDLRHDPTTAVNVSGNQLPFTSKTQVSVGAEYQLPIDGIRASLGAEYAWRSKMYFTEFNTADAMQDSYGILNLSFTVRPTVGHWKVFGYVKNATNTAAVTSMSIASPILGAARQAAYTAPRMYGLGLQLDF
jgi:outer membrane receptor protein involved in Fe transport